MTSLTFQIAVLLPDGSLSLQPASPEKAAKADPAAFLRFAEKVWAVAEKMKAEEGQLRMFEVNNVNSTV